MFSFISVFKEVISLNKDLLINGSVRRYCTDYHFSNTKIFHYFLNTNTPDILFRTFKMNN